MYANRREQASGKPSPQIVYEVLRVRPQLRDERAAGMMGVTTYYLGSNGCDVTVIMKVIDWTMTRFCDAYLFEAYHTSKKQFKQLSQNDW